MERCAWAAEAATTCRVEASSFVRPDQWPRVHAIFIGATSVPGCCILVSKLYFSPACRRRYIVIEKLQVTPRGNLSIPRVLSSAWPFVRTWLRNGAYHDVPRGVNAPEQTAACPYPPAAAA